MRTAIALFTLAAALPSFAAIDGTVVNGTTGKPHAGVTVTLLKPGQQGMQNLGSTTSDASGRFLFQNDQPGGGPQLLQAAYDGVNYNKLLTPNIPTSNVQLDIYESDKSPAVARIAQQMLVLEPTLSQTNVSETIVVQNDSKTTYNNKELGGLRFFLPPAANGQVRVSAQGPGGMPLPRAAEKTPENDVFKVDFPIKPGETEFQVSYVLPVGSPSVFKGRVVSVKGMPAGPLRLIAPTGVTLSGNDIQSLGTEPKTQASIYNVNAPADFTVNVSGTGALHSDSENSSETDTSDQPKVQQAQPQIYAHRGSLIGLTLAILAVGFAFLYRTSPVRAPSESTGAK